MQSYDIFLAKVYFLGVIVYFCSRFKLYSTVKKGFALAIAMMGLMLGLCSCDKTNDEIREFLQQYYAAVQAGNKEEMAKFYPAAADADSVAFQLNIDSLKIEKLEDGNYFVNIAPGVDATLAHSDDGKMEILSSHGMFAYPAGRLYFAKKTGQYKPELNDAANALRMGDERFMASLSEQIFGEIKKNIKLSTSSSSTMWDGFPANESTLTVTNNNDFDLPGDAYTAYAKLYACMFDESMGFGLAKTRGFSGKPIPAHGKVSYYLGKHDYEYEYWDAGSVTINALPDGMIASLYTPTGNEYDQFVAEHGEPKVIKTNLSLDMRGLMGNCGTHITFSGKKGAMQYNANSTSLEMASDAQQRVLTLMSYDEPTGKLVLQVRRGNTVTGNLDGTLHDGTFEGKFRNVNGSASSFSFK